MRQYTLGDIFAALDAEKNMPAALYADAARSAGCFLPKRLRKVER